LSEQIEIEKFSIKDFLLQEHKMLKVNDIEKDVNWLYERVEKTKPIIKIFKSSIKFRKFLRTQTNYGDNLNHRYYSCANDNLVYGLRHEMEYFIYCMKRLESKKWLPDEDKKYINFLSKGIWEFIPTTLRGKNSGVNVIAILPLPKKLRINENGNYHSLEKPAIEWHDGKGKYYIHGVRFSKKLFKQVASRQLPAMRVLEIPNIEQRGMTLRIYGAEKLFAELNPQLLDTFEREITILERSGESVKEVHKLNKIELYRINIGDRQTRFDDDGKLIDNADYVHIAKYNCPSTERVYTSFVPNTIYLACSAMAWKNSLRTIGYVKHLKIEA